MRVAIVAPSPIPFLVGGAENLWWGMMDYLRGNTAHLADLIKVPVQESSLVDLVAGYEAFSRLDMSGFDAVISTKYPAWMVRHPNHTVYLQHRCRGFYDWYPAAAAGGYEYAGDDAGIRELLAFIQAHREERRALPEFFSRFDALARSRPPESELFRHPGPVGRAIIHYLDGVGLARSAIRRYAAIAEEVKRRPEYFPPGADVKVVYHPTNKTGFRDAGADYFFTASRFYPSKRIELLIDAYRRTSIALPLRIAGTGDEEARLRRHAGDDKRIEFLGFVDDAQLVELYSRALAIAFAPEREDFGYITLEAMLAGKPVITTVDAGGPVELVRDGVNGLVTAPTVEALAHAFERIAADPAAARVMGERGRERASAITWPQLFSTLLGEGKPAAKSRAPRTPRARVTVLNAYAVHPPNNGGRYRLHSLYRSLSRHVDVDLVTLGLRDEGDDVIWVDEGLRELRVARTREHERRDLEMQARAGVPVYDITALENIALTPAYTTVLENSLAGSRAAVVSHPYMLEALRRTAFAGRFLHEAHNCEHTLKARMLPESPVREHLLELVEQAERRCCVEAALTFATCAPDAQALCAEYGVSASNMIVVPNGTDTRRIAYAGAEERRRVKARLGMPDEPIALFLASGHRPNIEAAQYLFNLAPAMPDVRFALVGNLADAFTHVDLPSNVWRVGTVSEEARNVWLQAADVALNPVLYGGGTNLKLLDYFAAGTPVVSTEIGVRGTEVVAGRHVLVAPIDGFEAPIRQVLAGGPAIERMTAQARRLAEDEFDWDGLADRLHREMIARGLLAPA